MSSNRAHLSKSSSRAPSCVRNNYTKRQSACAIGHSHFRFRLLAIVKTNMLARAYAGKGGIQACFRLQSRPMRDHHGGKRRIRFRLMAGNEALRASYFNRPSVGG